MKYITIVFLTFIYIKSIYYGKYEIQMSNYISGIFIFIFSSISFIFPITLLLTIY